MSKLRGKWRKVRRAGLMHSMAAARSRAVKRFAATSVGQRIVPVPGPVSEDQLYAAIDFEDIPRGDLVERFVHRPAARHVLSDVAATAEIADREFPYAVSATIAEAERVCRHEFRFLGKSVTFGDEIDWNWNPDGFQQWPLAPSSDFGHRLSYFGEDRLGDVKYPWELQRHHHFVTLGKAWVYTGEEKYARECTRQLQHWLDANPYGHGLAWYGSLEFGIRIVSWTNAFAFLKSSEYFRAHGIAPFFRGLYMTARRLDHFLTTDWLVPTNHLIGEAAGLFAFSASFPEFRESPRWKRKALNILQREVLRQTYPDGVNREQATGYHRFVVDFALYVWRLAQKNSIALSEEFVERLERMIEYEWLLLEPGGRAPIIGDCDDGRGVFLSESCRFEDFRGWVAAGAALFDRPELKTVAPHGSEEALWFLGPEDWKRYTVLPPEADHRTSVLFREGGQAVLRSHHAHPATVAVLRCGEFGLGLDGSCGHSHADMLAPVIFWRGALLAVDAGTFAYYCREEKRLRFRSTSYHNTICPEETEQGEVLSINTWGAIPVTEVCDWRQDDDNTSGTFRMTSPNGYTQERRMTLAANATTLEIADLLTSSHAGDVVWQGYFHFAPGLSARADGHTVHVLDSDNRPLVYIETSGFSDVVVGTGWYSPSYGVQIPNQHMRMTATGNNLSVSAFFRDPEREHH